MFEKLIDDNFVKETNKMMKIEIELSEKDFEKIRKTSMSIDDMDNTVIGRVYTSIIKGYKKDHPEEFGVTS